MKEEAGLVAEAQSSVRHIKHANQEAKQSVGMLKYSDCHGRRMVHTPRWSCMMPQCVDRFKTNKQAGRFEEYSSGKSWEKYKTSIFQM